MPQVGGPTHMQIYIKKTIQEKYLSSFDEQ